MYSLLLLLHHFGEDGILELLHLQHTKINYNLFVGSTVQSSWPTRLGLLYSSTVLSTVKATLSSLENFGAQRAIQVQTAAFSSPRN